MSVKNIEKFLEYVTMVAKTPIIVDGQPYFRKKERIRLQYNFFYKDTCQFCGGCCVYEHNLYTPQEYQWILNCPKSEFDKWGLDYSDLDVLKSGLIEERHTIGLGVEKVFHRFNKIDNDMYLPTREKVIPRCAWLKKYEDGTFKCKIHPVVSLTCDMPHLRFMCSKRGTVSIGIQQFGRNWALHCPVAFSEPQTEEEFNEARASRIRKLQRLDMVTCEFGVKSWVPELIDYINSIPYDHYKDYLGVDAVITHRKFF